jgi:antitoxin component of RelBE/YafQ-DinJ toxin-antitoxin module
MDISKTSDIRLRIQPSIKNAFKNECKRRGMKMSELIEQFILLQIKGTTTN